MKTGKPINTKVDSQLYYDNLKFSSEGMFVTMDNQVRVENKQIEIAWLISRISNVSHAILIDYGFATTVKIISVDNYDTDVRDLKLLVSDSCADFMDILKNLYGKAPMIELKFEEIAIRIVELMEEADLY